MIKLEVIPFNIPLCIYGKPTDTYACIEERWAKPEKRVIGFVVYENWKGEEVREPFDVKHDDKSFAVGSGSSKKRFYFNNWQLRKDT